MEPNGQPADDAFAGLNIDYENLDAADLNERLRAAAAAGAVPGAPAVSPETPAPPAAAPAGPPPPAFKSRMKGRLRRLLGPFFPFLRILNMPVQEDLAEATRILHATNVRVDQMTPTLSRAVEYLRIMHVINHNLVMELTKLRIEHDTLKNQVRLMEKELEFLTRRERAVERRLVP
jgi:hypothetical protein